MKPMKFKPYSREKIEQFRFVKLPKALFEDEMFDDLSIYAKVLYGFMRDRLDLSVASGLFDKDTGNYFIYYTVEDVKKNLHCANSKACALLKELEDVGLILRTRQGQGKAAKIYVNNFAECDDEEIGDKEVFAKTESYTINLSIDAVELGDKQRLLMKQLDYLKNLKESNLK